jgi:thioredoxin-related protein
MKRNNFISNIIVLLLSLFFTVNCVPYNTHKTTLHILQDRLSGEKHKTSLVLFISESMCSECVNIEFQNIKENKDNIKYLTIIGSFEQKRHFDACIASLTSYGITLEKIYINTKEIKEIISFPFYFFYNSNTISLSDIFYPEPCAKDVTVKYYNII